MNTQPDLENLLLVRTAPGLEPEKQYAFHVLLREMLGLEFRIEFQETTGHTLQLPNGARLHFPDHFSIAAPMAPGISLDPFAAAFHLLTRREEQVSSERDKHGRFPASASAAWKQGFLDRPVVNEWVEQIWEQLQNHGWRGTRKQRQFKISVSCDVDHPRLWWHWTERLRTLGGALLRRGNLQEAGYWLRRVGVRRDPYDVFDAWLDFFAEKGVVAQFNFMGERLRHSDCWYPLRHPFVQNLMQKIADRGHTIGFHPSYESFGQPEIFQKELASLREVSPLEIRSGRQHYLRFAAPDTWRIWADAGLSEDCTLGYPEAEGFRCGICHDYPVFDTERRQMLPLREKPLLAMDVTLAQYRQYSPRQAAERLAALRKTVEKYRGDFSVLWHNSSWNTPYWEIWKPVFEGIFKQKTN